MYIDLRLDCGYTQFLYCIYAYVDEEPLTSEIRPQPDVVPVEEVPDGLRHVLEILGVVRVVLAADDAETVKGRKMKTDHSQQEAFKQLTKSPPKCVSR